MRLSLDDEAAPKPAKKMGRPTLFTKRLAQTILKMAETGATAPQIAKAAGVSESVIKNWMGRHPDFMSALKKSKDFADAMVEASLYQRALGYSHPAIKFFCTKQGDIKHVEYLEHYPPDTTACIFWLKNRQKDNWRERQEPVAESDSTITLNYKE